MTEHTRCPTCLSILDFTTHRTTGVLLQVCPCGTRPMPIRSAPPIPRQRTLRQPPAFSTRRCAWNGCRSTFEVQTNALGGSAKYCSVKCRVAAGRDSEKRKAHTAMQQASA